QDCDMVVAVSRADGTHGARLTNCRGDLGIATGFARRDLAELAPDGFLEGGTSDVDRQLTGGERAFDGCERTVDQVFQAAAILDDRRLWEAPPKGGLVIVEGEPANALGRRRDKHLPDGAVEMGPADCLTLAAVPPRGRSHAQPLLCITVEA